MEANMKKLFAMLIVLLFCNSAAVGAGILSLKESIEIAKKNSDSMAIAGAKVEQAEALAGEAFSAFLPTLRLDVSLGRSYSEMPPIVTGNPLFPEFQQPAHEINNFTYSAGLTQNLYTGGAVWNSFAAADLGVVAAREDYRARELALIYDVISAYYTVIKANKGLDLSQESLDMANKHLEQTKTMFSSGVVTKADVLRSELDVAKAELNLTKAKSAVDLANNSFNLTIGMSLDMPVALEEKEFKQGGLLAPNYNEFLAIAYKERPEWRMSILGKDIADKQSQATFGGYLPSVLLSGAYGYNDYNDQKSDIDENLNNWNIALVGSWTVFDGFNTPNRVKEANAKYVETAKNMDLLKKSIAIDVKNACSTLTSAMDAVRSAQKALELADENYKIAELRYSSGVGTNVEVMDAKTMYTSANLDLLQAQFDYDLAKAALNKAVGSDLLPVGTGGNAAGGNEITLSGTVQYISIEGGFIGFVDDKGNKYDPMGAKVSEIRNVVGTSANGKKIKITGIIKKDIATIHMWGTPFMVTGYEWE